MADDDPLRVFDAARRFGEMVAEMTRRLPRRAPSGPRGQLAKAAGAVSALLAEGFGRGTKGEKTHYSLMANGSLEESQDDLKKSVNLRLIDRKEFFRLWNFSVAISKMIVSLVEYFERTKDE